MRTVLLPTAGHTSPEQARALRQPRKRIHAVGLQRASAPGRVRNSGSGLRRGRGRGGGAGAAFAGGGGAGWLGIDRIRSYRADRIVDYTATPVLQAVAGQRYDVVLNLAPTSPEETAQLVGLVADGGAFVSTTTPGPEDAGRGVRTVRVFVRSDAAQLTELVTRVDDGVLEIEVAERRPLADLAAVHDQAAAGWLAGKTVLTP